MVAFMITLFAIKQIGTTITTKMDEKQAILAKKDKARLLTFVNVKVASNTPIYRG